MAILKVASLGNPVLRERAREVAPHELRDGAFARFLDDLVDTMREYEGVGLAAPQVHRSIRVAAIESWRNARYPEAPEVPLRVLINPLVTPLTDEPIEWWEGCLSIPGLRGLVRRPRRVRVASLDAEGRSQEFEAEGFLAVVVQHEVDHLDGKVFLERMEDLRTLAFQKEYERYWATEGGAPPGSPEEESEAGPPAARERAGTAAGGDA